MWCSQPQIDDSVKGLHQGFFYSASRIQLYLTLRIVFYVLQGRHQWRVMGRNGHCDRFRGGFQSAVGMSSSRPLAPSCLQLRDHWFANDPLTEVGGEDTLSPSMGSSMARSGIPAAAEDNFALVTVIVVIRNLISFLNPNINSFVIKTLIYLVEMRLEWIDNPWGFTETCGCVKFFKPLYCLHNSSLLIPITIWQSS